ncbi:hypothetical protein BaRGS_00010375 [Batillaria attramentaria]|uniref:Uncharacterized protein n=1 Tax=Batillaria attramentaria TaxID=370345 RepID=A0ABD0LGT7_9CAEN
MMMAREYNDATDSRPVVLYLQISLSLSAWSRRVVPAWSAAILGPSLSGTPFVAFFTRRQQDPPPGRASSPERRQPADTGTRQPISTRLAQSGRNSRIERGDIKADSVGELKSRSRKSRGQDQKSPRPFVSGRHDIADSPLDRPVHCSIKRPGRVLQGLIHDFLALIAIVFASVKVLYPRLLSLRRHLDAALRNRFMISPNKQGISCLHFYESIKVKGHNPRHCLYDTSFAPQKGYCSKKEKGRGQRFSIRTACQTVK